MFSLLAAGPGLAQESGALGEEARPATLPLSLEEAVGLALEANLDIALEVEQGEVLRFQAIGSWGAFDPLFSLQSSIQKQEFQSVSQFSGAEVVENDELALQSSLLVPFKSGGNFSLGFNRVSQETNSIFANFTDATTDNFSLSFVQPLLRGAWERYATLDQRAAHLQAEIAYERRRQVRQEVQKSVHDAYWNLVASMEERGVREFALQLGRRQLADQQRRLEVGVGTEVEVLQAETNVSSLLEQQLLAETNVRAAMDVLLTLLYRPEEGVPTVEGYVKTWDANVVPLSPLPVPPEGGGASVDASWESSLVVALGGRSELAQQRLSVDAAELEVLRARSSLRPQLDLTLNANSSGFGERSSDALSDAAGFDFPTYRAELSYSLPIGNRSASNALEAARLNVRIARLTYDRVERDIVAETRAAVRDLRYQAEASIAAGRSVELGRRQLAAEERSYAEGASTLFRVLEFQQQFQQALSSEKAALAGYARARAALLKAEGRLMTDSHP